MLADIATKHPTPNLLSKILMDEAFILDRKVGNAASGIQGSVWKDAVGRTCIDTTGATPTTIILKGWIWFEFEIGKKFREQEVRTQAGMN